MLNTITQKICPILSVVIFGMACGKKINEPNSNNGNVIENQEISSVYVINLDGSISSLKNYLMPKATQFEIPTQLKVISGTPRGKVVEIAYDVNEFDSDDYQFKCSYVSSSSSTELILKNCVDYYGYDFGDVSNHQFTLNYNDIIQIRFKGPSALDFAVEAVYSMNWI